MLAAPVFFRAIVFSVRTSDEVHERRFDFCSQNLLEGKAKKCRKGL
jgi:hypothetical protein